MLTFPGFVDYQVELAVVIGRECKAGTTHTRSQKVYFTNGINEIEWLI
jgi:2-keto-4-pentenoate hydratase/2-oxohepta-3-ene-1,7-dioic acid hydratase in catechol pathway